MAGMTHNHSYAPARTTNLRDQQNNSNFPRKMQGKVSRCSFRAPTSTSPSGSSIFSQCIDSEIPGNDPGINQQLHHQRRRPSSILPVGITFNNKSKRNNGSTVATSTGNTEINNPGHQPKVVLTPESPYDSKLGSKTLYDPNGNEDSGLSMFGTASTLTATCVDIDMESLLSESSKSDTSTESSVRSSSSSASNSSRSSLEEPVCSVARAMYCHGNFRFLDDKGQSVASTAFTSMTVSSTASMSTPTPTISRAQPQIVLRNETSPSSLLTKSDMPLTKLNMPLTVSDMPLTKSETITNQHGVLAINRNVDHDEGISLKTHSRHPQKAFNEANLSQQSHVGDDGFEPRSRPTSLLLLQQNPYRKIFEQRQQFYEKMNQMTSTGSTSSTCSIKGGWQRCQTGIQGIKSRDHVFTVRTNIEPFGPFVIEHDVKSQGPGKLSHGNMICLNPESESELRYATSHSGEGVESHLEVSLGKDGSIIKTRHQRLDQNSTENSILKLQYGEGGKVLEIQQTQSVTAVPIRDKSHLSPAATGGARRLLSHRPTSAYCTSGPTSMNNLQQFLVPRYNSMPNLDRSRTGRLTSSELGFNIHPADEEKRMAYTRGTCLK